MIEVGRSEGGRREDETYTGRTEQHLSVQEDESRRRMGESMR